MKIAFLLRHPLYLRNYEQVLRTLAGNGHQILLSFSPLEKQVDRILLNILLSDCPTIEEVAIGPRKGWWWPVSDAVRAVRDYLRYLEPDYAGAKALVDRGGRHMPPIVRLAFEKLPFLSSGPLRRLTAWAGALVDRCIPPDPGLLATLRHWRPDLLLVTPMIDFTYGQTDYVKAARRLGIPTVLAVASWDNLTNKGLVQVCPDRVLVWNDIQQREAVQMHAIPPDRICVTGAQLFDQWFEMTPSTDRAAFCARVGGLDPEKPILLYLCSSTFVCPEEVPFVKEWLSHLRTADDDKLRTANVIVRPHPAHIVQWRNVDLSGFGPVVIWPPEGGAPVDEARKRDYFDSLHHAAAVVGINTSGLIEAGIIGRRTFTVLERFAATQQGTLHFHYLTQGGLLQTAKSFADHFGQLAHALRNQDEAEQEVRSFIASFVRPAGIERPATPVIVEAIESAPAIAPQPWRTPFYAPLVRALLWPGAVVLRRYMLARTNKGMYRGIERTQVAQFLAPKGRSTRHSDAKVRRFERTTHAALAKLADSRKPIIVGPWLSEVGFELLYWIPMVRWAQDTYGLERERLVVVSRGGVESWYADIAARYVDMFDFLDPAGFVAFNEERQKTSGMQKQKFLSEAEQRLLQDVQKKLGIGDFDLLHPELMYSGVLRYHWSQRSSMDHLLLHARYKPLPKLQPGEIEARLPNDYYAVRFYSRESFPDSADNRRFVRRLIERMLERRDVVLLDNPFAIDDHANVQWMNAAATGEGYNNRLIQAGDWMTPRNNLDVQSRIIARAHCFVGTYGGLSYLAPLFGKASIGFHQNARDVMDAHVNTAQTVCRGLGASLILLTPEEAELVTEIV